MMKPLVALVGRPNVGKSTLFNRIVGERIAIVEDVAGTTRDRLYYDADWNGRQFTLVDTGGLEIEPGSDLAKRVRQQAEVAVAEADVVLFVVDALAGISAGDADVAALLRTSGKSVLLVVNKAETPGRRLNAAEFYELGLGSVYAISALHGTGTGELLDAIVALFPPAEPEPIVEIADAMTGTRLAFVGRPNVGKSSLVNALLGWERAVVTDIPGTTRDALDTEIIVDGKSLTLIDTAGVRRRGRIERGVEQYSVLRAIRAIERADIVGIVIDASEGVTAQDTHLAGFAADEAKGLLLIVNKWDTQSPTSQARDAFLAIVREEMKFVPYAPVVFVSALKGTRVKDVFKTAFECVESRRKRVPTATLNDLVAEAVHAHGPPSDRGRSLKVYYVTQVAINPPTFVFFVNDSELLHYSYRRYLENRLRDAFGFAGTAIRMVFRNRVDERIASRPR
jgi:GTP-binding protein